MCNLPSFAWCKGRDKKSRLLRKSPTLMPSLAAVCRNNKTCQRSDTTISHLYKRQNWCQYWMLTATKYPFSDMPVKDPTCRSSCTKLNCECPHFLLSVKWNLVSRKKAMQKDKRDHTPDSSHPILLNALLKYLFQEALHRDGMQQKYSHHLRPHQPGRQSYVS